MKPTTTSDALPPRVVRVPQHRVGLADAGRGPDVDAQPRPLRVLHAREHLLAGRPALGLHDGILRADRAAPTAFTAFLPSLERSCYSARPLRWSHDAMSRSAGGCPQESSATPRLSCSSRSPLGSADLRRAQPTALIGAIWVLGTKKGTW